MRQRRTIKGVTEVPDKLSGCFRSRKGGREGGEGRVKGEWPRCELERHPGGRRAIAGTPSREINTAERGTIARAPLRKINTAAERGTIARTGVLTSRERWKGGRPLAGRWYGVCIALLKGRLPGCKHVRRVEFNLLVYYIIYYLLLYIYYY